MATISSIFSVIAIIAFLLGLAAGGIYLFRTLYPGEPVRWFTPRIRRLAYIERTRLDGGRKLLLVRRDDVEHLLLIGGPIDLVVETGIRLEGAGELAAASSAVHAPEPGWHEPDISLAARLDLPLPAPFEFPQPAAKASAPAEPRLSLSPKKAEPQEEMLELTALQEAKPAQ